MKEIWKPINPKLNIEDCYEVSNLGRIRNTRYNKIQDDIHHSTNGFDYIFIATKDHKPSYQHIDIIVCMTFCQENVNNVECGKPIIPYHKDGDRRNNQSINLEFVEDVEIWKPIVYKDIIPGMYSVSNHGRVFSHDSNRLKPVSCNGRYYPTAKFRCKGNILRKYDLHPIIATMFVPGYDDKHNIVNHIDNTYNNHWRNIEWCTFSWNNSHARHLDNPRGKYKLTIDQCDYIRDLIMTYKNPSQVYQMIDTDKCPQISMDIIDSIKGIDAGYRKSWKYTQKELKEFRNNTLVRRCYTASDIHHFCNIIKDCNYDIAKTYDILSNEGYPVTRCNLHKLKTCETYKEITERYFK